MTQLEQERYPEASVPAELPLPPMPTSDDQILTYLQRVHLILAQNQIAISNAIAVLDYHRTVVATEVDSGGGGGGGTAQQPDATGSNAQQVVVDRTTGEAQVFVDLLDAVGVPTWFQVGTNSHAKLVDRDAASQHPDSSVDLSGTHDALLSGATTVADAMTALDDLDGASIDIDDEDVDLSGTHTALLSGATTVADAMAVLDDLNGSGIDIDDDDVDLSGVHAGLLSGLTTVSDAMIVLDDLDDSDIPMSAAKTGWLLAASGGDVADALATIDGFQSNGVIFNNNVGVRWKNNAGTATLDGFKLNTSDQIEAGQNVILKSANWLLGLHSTSGFLYLIGTISDGVQVGSGSYGTRIASGGNLLLTPGVDVEVTAGSVQTINNEGYTAKDTGGTQRNVGKVNSSNEAEVGDANLPLVLKANGTIDAGANDIETTGDVDCANTIANFDRALKKTTLTSGSGITFLKLPLDLNKAASCEVYWEVEAAKSGTVEFCSGNARFSAKRLSGGVTVTSVTEWGRDNGLAGALTVNLTSSGVSAYEGRMQITATTSTTGMTITLRVRCMSASETQPVWNF